MYRESFSYVAVISIFLIGEGSVGEKTVLGLSGLVHKMLLGGQALLARNA